MKGRAGYFVVVMMPTMIRALTTRAWSSSRALSSAPRRHLPLALSGKSGAGVFRMTLFRAYSTSKEDSSTDKSAIQDTVAEALQQGLDMLQAHDIDEPELSVTNLLALCLELPWESGHRDLKTILQSPSSSSSSTSGSSSLGRQQLTCDQAAQFDKLLQRRLQHEPIQYLVGQWDFYNHVFSVEPPLLCPRPETEQLVELMVADVMATAASDRNNNSSSSNSSIQRPIRILDIGAGTGCLGISIAAAAATRNVSVAVHAIDIEPVAVQVATKNAARILGSDWKNTYTVSLISVDEYRLEGNEPPFDIVVSNPPYIPRADYDELHPTVKNYESADALVAGDDGMDVIRTILQRLPSWAQPGALCWMEVDPSQPTLIQSLYRDNKLEYVETIQDIFGRDRFVKLRVS